MKIFNDNNVMIFQLKATDMLKRLLIIRVKYCQSMR